MSQEGLCHQWNQRLFRERASFFSVQQEEDRKIFLHNEIRVSMKIEVGNMAFNLYV